MPGNAVFTAKMKIKERTFLVTGGASGLGEAAVRTLVERGANVIIWYG